MNEIVLKDCIDGIKELQSETIDVVIADPPYNIGKDFGNNSDKQDFEKYLIWCSDWINECFRVLKPNGSMFIYGFSEILAFIFVNIKHSKKWLIWHYTNKTTPTAKIWIRAHESIIHCYKEIPIFNQNDIRVPYSKDFSSLNGKVRPNTSGRFGDQETIYNFNDQGALPRDVINIPALAGGAGQERVFLCNGCNSVFLSKFKKEHKEHGIIEHPTQKPYKLTEILIKSSIDKSMRNSVLIPFAGTGMECRVAQDLGQDFIAFEINKDFVNMGNKVIQKSFIL